jgi:uncharacterized damage-inducible protein DinB
LIARIRALPALLQEAVEGLDDEKLNTPYRPGGWTVRQVVHHLADSHMHAYLRMKLTFWQDHPVLNAYNQDDWATTKDVTGLPVESSLQILAGLHRRWVEFLASLPDSAWQRTAHHPERGTITLMSLLHTYAEHGHRHVQQIRELRTSRGW